MKKNSAMPLGCSMSILVIPSTNPGHRVWPLSTTTPAATKNPNDNNDQRFDTLFGARRFDFGPTGIYGAFARSNINTPGYRITLNPRSDLQLGVSHRAFWLASDTDAWTTTGPAASALRDRSGNTSNYIGQQLELTARYDFNSSLGFETGWTHLFKGDFAKDAPNSPDGKDIDLFLCPIYVTGFNT